MRDRFLWTPRVAAGHPSALKPRRDSGRSRESIGSAVKLRNNFLRKGYLTHFLFTVFAHFYSVYLIFCCSSSLFSFTSFLTHLPHSTQFYLIFHSVLPNSPVDLTPKGWERWSAGCGRPVQRVEEQGTWASRTRKRGEAGGGRPLSGGVWAAKTVKRPPQQPAQPRYANYWAPLTHKRHLSQPAQPQYTNDGAPRMRKRHQQEQRPQRPTERSDPTQHAKGRTGDRPGPRKETTTRRNVTQGAHEGGGGVSKGDGC